MLHSKTDQFLYKRMDPLISLLAFPVYPANAVILTIGIVISFLGITDLISTVDHRRPLCKKYHGKCITDLPDTMQWKKVLDTWDLTGDGFYEKENAREYTKSVDIPV